MIILAGGGELAEDIAEALRHRKPAAITIAEQANIHRPFIRLSS